MVYCIFYVGKKLLCITCNIYIFSTLQWRICETPRNICISWRKDNCVCVMCVYVCVCVCVSHRGTKSMDNSSLCVCVSAEASEGGVVLVEAKKFLIRYLKDVRTTHLALGRREVRVHIVHVPIDCTCKWIGNAAYIVYVTSLAILRTVTERRKLAGVTNDKESVLL